MKTFFGKKMIACLLPFLLASCGSLYDKGQRHFTEGEYQPAIQKWAKVLEQGNAPQGNGALNYQIGEAYRLSNRVAEALPYYQKAQSSGYFNDSLTLVLGYAYKANGNYQAAHKTFEEYSQNGSNPFAREIARSEVANYQKIDSLAAPNPMISVTHCDTINTEAAEYAPVLWNDQLVFTSSRGDGKVYEGTGTRFTDLYKTKIEEGAACGGAVESFNELINLSALHEAAPAFTADGKTMIFARSNPGRKKDEYREVDLFISRFNGSQWSEPERLSISRPEDWDSCPTLSPDGETLYFASNRPGGEGGVDIFRATRGSDGQYKNPTPLGKSINTPGNELFPYVSADRKLYYASDGLPGLGGLDLFVAVNEEGKPVQVSNLGAPFNSTGDDFAIIFKDEKTGYFTSNRKEEGAKGDDDIYYFVDETPDLEDVKYFLAGIAYGTINQKPKEILPGSTVKLQGSDGTILETKTADEKGYFRFETPLEIGPVYKVQGDKATYMAGTNQFVTAGKEATPEDLKLGKTEFVFETDVLLKKDLFEGKLETGEEVVLKNILYDLDKWFIRPDAAKELDKLVQYMKDRPEIRVELGSHTDVRASDRYNMTLSQKRAESAVTYIVEHGIDASRIEAKGYGETQLLIKDAKTEEEHQLNRRTTVRLLD